MGHDDCSVVSVAVLACFSVKHVLTWLKKPRRRFLPFPGSMILSRHRFRESSDLTRMLGETSTI
jgi:hypothetical protein